MSNMEVEQEQSRQVKLQTKEGQIFTIPEKVACMMQTVKNLLDDLDDADVLIPLEDVEGPVFEKVVEYLTHHKDDDPSAAIDEKRTDNIIPWDADFMRTADVEMLFKILTTASFLDTKPLLHLACKIVANVLKGITPEDRHRIKADPESYFKS